MMCNIFDVTARMRHPCLGPLRSETISDIGKMMRKKKINVNMENEK